MRACTSSWRSSPTSERLAVARITGAKGLAGALRIEPVTDWPEHLAVGAAVYLEGQDEARRVIAAEWGGRIPSLTLEGLSTREDAEGLIGRYLEIDAQDLPGGTYYWHQIIGLVVHDERGQELGVVREVFRAGEAEVYRVEQTDGGELLIPGVRDVVRRIDLDAGLMVVHYESEEIR